MLAKIEQAIKDKLQQAINDKQGQYYGWVRAVKSYGGDFDDENFNQVIRALPAIWVTFKSASKPIKKGAKKRQRQYDFTVLVGANSGRAEPISRQGAFDKDGKLLNVGSYQLIELVDKALEGAKLTLIDSMSSTSQPLELPCTALESGAIKTIFNTKTDDSVVSVLSYDVSTTATYYIGGHDEDDDELPWLEHIEMSYFDYLQDDASGELIAVELANELIKLN